MYRKAPARVSQVRPDPSADTSKVDLTSQARALVRLASAVATYQGNGNIFGPGIPMTPSSGEEAPIMFEYQSGVNLNVTPRTGFGSLMSFSALRALAQVKEIRLNIELIKRQICGMEWEIVPAETPKEVMVGRNAYEKSTETDEVKAFFEKPDGVNEWDSWLKMLLEDLLVIDAVTLYPEYDERGRLAEINIVDGSTIRPLLDYRGRIPRAPMPAYVQVLHGIPRTWYDATSLMYKPLNTKSHTPYGETPAEWIINTINIAIRREAQKNAYYTDGNIPGAIVYLGDLTTEQLKVIEEYANAIISGDIARASKLLFLPGGGSGTSVFPFQQNNQDDTKVDEWLMMVACWAFGNSPSEFGLIPGSQGLGGSGYMEGGENNQYRSMIGPVTGYVAGLINRVIRDCIGRKDIKFQFKNNAPQTDKIQQAQVDQIYIGTVYTPDYVADREGVPERYRVSKPASQPPASSFIPSVMMPFVKRAITGELQSWQGKAVRHFEKKRPGFATFESDVIPPDLNRKICDGLAKAQSTHEIENIFSVLLDQDTALHKAMHLIEHDPVAHVRQAAENDLEQAVAEYFEGLRQRIIQNTIA